tara:strand:- start:2162 stop:2401 length:240 start_codon:yes stop_codon:yes gene_type:complete
MSDKQDYYARNKQARKEYQRKYYSLNKESIQRKKRLEELHDPEKFEARRAYNKAYYEKNKEEILKKRAEAYAKSKKLKE